jgi:hypothetical protein
MKTIPSSFSTISFFTLCIAATATTTTTTTTTARDQVVKEGKKTSVKRHLLFENKNLV